MFSYAILEMEKQMIFELIIGIFQAFKITYTLTIFDKCLFEDDRSGNIIFKLGGYLHPSAEVNITF